MSAEAPGGFLARWSRRKAAHQAATQAPPPESQDPPPAELPPIESLGADSDYTVFLARGVSRAVQAQALRIAWASDPAIAEFRGMAEYAWDFNAPGYGDLAPGDDATAWLGQIVRSGAKMAGAAVAEPAAEPITAAVPAPEPAQPIEAAIAVEAPPVCVLPPADAAEPIVDTAASAPIPIQAAAVRRRHGGAVPV